MRNVKCNEQHRHSILAQKLVASRFVHRDFVSLWYDSPGGGKSNQIKSKFAYICVLDASGRETTLVRIDSRAFRYRTLRGSKAGGDLPS